MTKRKFMQRKPRAMETAAVERLLRTAATTDLSEPAPDLVARAVERALSASAQRQQASHLPFMPRGFPRAALGTVAFAGVVALTVAVVLPSSPRPPHSSPVPPAAITMPQAAARIATSPVVEAHTPLPTTEPHTVRLQTYPHRAAPRRFLARRHRRSREVEWSSRRLISGTPAAPKVVTISRVTTTRTTAASASKPILSIARVAPASRPFWHDEQVERDDYTVSAPAIIAEGTEQGVTSVTPAVVQVAFSTTHPVARNTAYDNEPNSQ